MTEQSYVVTGGSAGGQGGTAAGSITVYPSPIGRPADVVRAISAITAELPSIGKDDKGDGVNYKFRGIETLIGHLAPLLAKHGVVIVPRTKITEINRDVQNTKGQMVGWTETILSVDWEIYGPEGGCLKATTVGIGRDNSDKGSNKAQTQAFKYLLMELFAIGDKDDDSDGIPANGRPEATIGEETAAAFTEHIKVLEPAVKAECAKQIEALTGTRFFAQAPLSLLPQVASIIMGAQAENYKVLK